MTAVAAATLPLIDYSNTNGFDDIAPLRHLAMAACGYGVLRAAVAVVFQILVDRTYLWAELAGSVDYLHAIAWPLSVAWLTATLMLLLVVGSVMLLWGMDPRRIVIRVASWGIIVVSALNMLEEVITSVGEQQNWFALNAGGTFRSSFGIPGLAAWRFGVAFPDVALPIAFLSLLSKKGRATDGTDVQRTARCLAACALVYGAAMMSYCLFEEYSLVRWSLRSQSGWQSTDLLLLFRDLTLVATSMTWLVGAIPTILGKNWGRRLLVAGAGLCVPVVVIFTLVPMTKELSRMFGLAEPLPHPLADILASHLYQFFYRISYGIFPLTLLLVLYRRRARVS